MSSVDPIHLATSSKTEKDIALDIKQRLTEACIPILALAREANRYELDLQFAFSRDSFGQLKVEPIVIRRY